MFIQLGQLSVYLFYPLLIPISRIINNKVPQLIERTNDIYEYPIIASSLMFLAELLGGCLYFLRLCQFKANSKSKTITKHRLASQFPTLPSSIALYSNSWNTVLLIFCFSVFDLIGSVAFSGVSTPELNYLMQSIQIVLYALLTVRLLHYKLYRHQFLSLAIIIIGVIIVNIFIDFKKIMWYWIFLTVLSQFLYAVKFTGDKWIMLNKHYNPMLVLFLEGLFGFALCLLILLGLYLICPRDLSKKAYCIDLQFFNKLLFNDLYSLLIFVMCTGILNVCIFQTNYLFGPTLLVISDVLSSFVDWVVTSIIKHKVFYYVLAGYIIIIIGSLVYNEVIILNFCKLEYYTKKEIRERSSNETTKCDVELSSHIVTDEEMN